MNTFTDAFELPVELEIGGKKISVHPNTTRDYLPWLAELTEQARARERDRIPKNLPPKERAKVIRAIEMEEVTPNDLRPKVFTADGQIRVLEIALVKALRAAGDEGDDESLRKWAAAFVDGRSAWQNEQLALRLGGVHSRAELLDLLYPDAPDDVGKDGKPVPNAGEPGPQSQRDPGSSVPTTPSTDSSSSSTLAATPST